MKNNNIKLVYSSKTSKVYLIEYSEKENKDIITMSIDCKSFKHFQYIQQYLATMKNKNIVL